MLTTLVFAASYGIAFGAIQQLPQILGAPNRGHVEVLAEGAAARARSRRGRRRPGGEAPPPEPRLRQIAGNAADQAVAHVTFWQEMGGLAGRFALAMLAVAIVSRRTLLRIFQIPALIFVPLFFWWVAGTLGDARDADARSRSASSSPASSPSRSSVSGATTSRSCFPLHLRGTGESFAANIGGRVIGTAAAWLTITFSESRPPDPAKIAVVGATVAGLYALVGAVLTQWLPEPGTGLKD